jgi:hypothetical protein
MPFLEGIPCSIQGIVASPGVSVFRPIEVITFVRSGKAELLYAGEASYWDPDPDALAEMREIGRRAGEALAERVGFRGAYSVDGVLTASGFYPTELNTRISSGLLLLELSLPELPLTLLALATQAGDRVELSPERLEALIDAAVEVRRHAVATVPVRTPPKGVRRLSLKLDEQEGYVLDPHRERTDGELILCRSEVGGLLQLLASSARTPAGPTFAPRAAAAYQLAERLLSLGFGSLDVAPGVR